jgi:hypothetical protein
MAEEAVVDAKSARAAAARIILMDISSAVDV